MYDTLMQMGRWFGYRPGYLDLCRLYTTSDLNEWFVHITQAAEELRREFDHMHMIKGTPKDYGLKVCSHPTMIVTSRVKMRNATEVQINFAGAIQETVTFSRSQARIKLNCVATELLLEAVERPTRQRRSVREAGESLTHGRAPVSGRMCLGRIVSFFKDYQTHESATSVNSQMMAEFVDNQIGRGELTDWTIALLAGDGPPMKVGGVEIDLVQRKENERSKNSEQQRADGVYLIRRLAA